MWLRSTPTTSHSHHTWEGLEEFVRRVAWSIVVSSSGLISTVHSYSISGVTKRGIYCYIQWTPSNPTTLGACQRVLIRGVASFQGSRLEGVHCSSSVWLCIWLLPSGWFFAQSLFIDVLWTQGWIFCPPSFFSQFCISPLIKRIQSIATRVDYLPTIHPIVS